MLGDNDTERVSAAAYVTFIVTLTHPRRRCMTPHQHAGYWSRSLRLQPCWVDPAERLPTLHGCENGETASLNYFTTKEWLHQPRLAGRSLHTHRSIKKRYGWMIGTDRQLRQTHTFSISLHLSAGRSSTKGDRSKNPYQMNLLVVSQDV